MFSCTDLSLSLSLFLIFMTIYPGCTPVRCRMHCPLGFKVDESGCDVCECDYSALSPSGQN